MFLGKEVDKLFLRVSQIVLETAENSDQISALLPIDLDEAIKCRNEITCDISLTRIF